MMVSEIRSTGPEADLVGKQLPLHGQSRPKGKPQCSKTYKQKPKDRCEEMAGKVLDL